MPVRVCNAHLPQFCVGLSVGMQRSLGLGWKLTAAASICVHVCVGARLLLKVLRQDRWDATYRLMSAECRAAY